ncbi:MAG: RdgB/HAM1 family non-canonical purine NTP pyrophosphatase [Pirellulaceae bacterium]
MGKFEIVLGSRNKKKARELDDLFGPSDIQLRPLADFPEAVEVEETGSTFQANAILKASVQARHLGRWVLGEDSGLSVSALNGEPGVWSARYAGEPSSDTRNNEKILTRLHGVPLDKRTAWYTCHMALSDPSGKIWIDCAGHCYGRILAEYLGDQGFGYDPLFEVVEYHQTFGQLGLAVKSLISHRARAARIFLREFNRLKSSLRQQSAVASS